MAFALINLREVRKRIPRSRSTLYNEIGRGLFPKPIKAGRSSFWRDEEVDELIKAYGAGADEAGLRSLCTTLYERRYSR